MTEIIIGWSLFFACLFLAVALRGFRLKRDDLFYGYISFALPFAILLTVTAEYVNK